ncbi:CpXC domain-containing protein [uncultured Streptococcus sp.]|uniref:CpXC domain-containing protein n=1 Tax=uncultured Streptococcus sp. TaxID=83427 RepID=UPI0025DE7EC0|nr:CpXC domain-containing protein [uncultured Streptococcus sp.]
MTTIFLTKTNCTNCGKQSTFERFDRVYAVKTPEIISAILDWDFFKFTCRNCNHMVLIDYPTVVVDEEQKTIIQYCADGNIDVLSMQICSLITEGVNLGEYKIRVVSDIESFVEKVQIVSAGYDDRAIELMKFMKFMNSPLEDGDIQFNYEYMVFTKVGQESYQFMFINNQIAVASLDFSQVQYEYYLADVEDLETNTYYIDSIWAELFSRTSLA